VTATGRISRDDIEARLRALEGDVTDRVVDRKGRIVQVAAAAGVAVLLVAFLLGVRRGRRKTTVVEIRRL
jgi:hypothetical protein